MAYGYTGRILKIDLTRNQVVKQELPSDLMRNYLGGRGLNARILWDELPSRIDPFSPKNVLAISAGPLCGTAAPSCAKLTITSKSPLTSFYFKSTVGGHFASELKFAGYDSLVIRGASESPVYLDVTNDGVEIGDAGHLWGKDVRETNRLLKKESADSSVLCIGPAGENAVLFASITSNVYRNAARGGLGAVMGIKKLKAIRVRGSGSVKVANPEEFIEAALRARKSLREDDFSWRRKYLFGTARGVVLANTSGFNPTRNFQTACIDGAHQIGGERIREKYLVRETGCSSCVMSCGRYYEIVDGPFAGAFSEGAEWGSIAALGPRIGSADPELVLKLNELCNIYGMDAESFGGVVGFTMELCEKGIVSKEDCDGLTLRWGDSGPVLALARKIAYREGFGDLLADGTRVIARKIGRGAERYAMQVKGLELTSVDLRVAKAYALAFAVNPRGGDHLHTNCVCQFGGSPEIVSHANRITQTSQGANPLVANGKTLMVKWHEDMCCVSDCLGMCFFNTQSSYRVDMKILAKLYSAATGIETTPDQMWCAGERILTLERAINLREGLRKEDDYLPTRMYDEKIESGPTEGLVLERDEFEKMLEEYYELHGWDRKNGVPLEDTLRRLGLEEIAETIRTPRQQDA